MVRDAIGTLPFARNKDEFDLLLGQIGRASITKIAEGAQASQSVAQSRRDGRGRPRNSARSPKAGSLKHRPPSTGVDHKVIQRLRQHGIKPAGL